MNAGWAIPQPCHPAVCYFPSHPVSPLLSFSYPCRPSGSGKSTSMVAAAERCRGKHPLLYIRLRSPDADDGTETVPADFTHTTQRIFEAIGYSTSPSFLESLLGRLKSLKVLSGEVELHDTKWTASRLGEAITDAYVAASRLAWLRSSPSIILTDEFQDLWRTKQGQKVFLHFLSLAVQHGTDDKRVLTVASNSTFIIDAVLKRDKQIWREHQPDPPVEQVRDALKAKGYTDAEIHKIVTVCGCRRRLLAPFLNASKDKMASREAWLEHRLQILVQKPTEALLALLESNSVSNKEKRLLGEFFDVLASDKPRTTPDLPEPYTSTFPSVLLHVGAGKRVYFQSEAARQAWIATRSTWTQKTADGSHPQ